MGNSIELEDEKLLILCVDRDNDIGLKAKVRTPLIGRKKNLESATSLILADSEEADANAMFEAIRIYDSMQRDKIDENNLEIATIAGSELGGLPADRKLVSELQTILSRFQAKSIILVTDGYSDEDIFPLIQSRVPVTSVRRVVVKHSESIEETAAVFSRYLKAIFEDPRYSKIAFGLPGILMISLAALVLLQIFIEFNIYTWASIVGLMILGSYLLGKGYGLDRRIYSAFSRMFHASVSDLVSGFSIITGSVLVFIGLYQGWDFVSVKFGISFNLPIDLNKVLELLPQVIGWLISKSLGMLVGGICVTLIGRCIGYLLERDSKFWRTVTLVAISAWFWPLLTEISEVLIDPSSSSNNLVISVILGIIVVVASGLTTHFLSKIFREDFQGSREKTEISEK